MVEADPSMRAGRNAFGVLLLVLIGAYIYTEIQGEPVQILFDIWLLGCVVYIASFFYYSRFSD